MQYCQHVLGIGHFFRSMEIAGAFHRHDVLFVEGGTPLENFTAPPHVRREFLPSLMMDTQFRNMNVEGDALETVQKERKRRLTELFHTFEPDVLLIELFPFGRKRFRFELVPILEEIRANRPSVKVVCSLRDILVEKEDQASYEAKVLEVLNRYFHLLLVHSDPQLITLEETFERVEDIRIPIRYTGFVGRPAPPYKKKPGGKKIITASSGGGKVGTDLLASVVEAVHGMKEADVELRVFIGPFTEEQDRKSLEQLARKDPRILIEPFAPDFLRELVRADLSISMAGYNTCMDILSAGVKALVYPFRQNREQPLRAIRLEQVGLLRVLEKLEIDYLQSAIREALETTSLPPPRMLPNLSGAKNTALTVEKYFCVQ